MKLNLFGETVLVMIVFLLGAFSADIGEPSETCHQIYNIWDFIEISLFLFLLFLGGYYGRKN